MNDIRPPHTLAGVWAAALTPLDEGLEPDAPRAIAHARWLLAHGCDGTLLLGTTGEANSLPLASRQALVAAAGPALPKDRLMVGIGSCALADAVSLAREALAAGCPNLLALPPFYYKRATEDGLFAYFAELIERVGDGRLRLYLYHIPRVSGVPVSVDLVRRLVTGFPGTVVGMKDSSGDWAQTAAFISEFPDLAIFSGTERHLVENLRAGGPGCISATANVSAPLIQLLYRAWRTPEAQRLAGPVLAARATVEGFAAIPALKALTRRRTGDAAWRNVLPPFLSLPAAEERELLAKLEAQRFFELVPDMAAA